MNKKILKEITKNQAQYLYSNGQMFYITQEPTLLEYGPIVLKRVTKKMKYITFTRLLNKVTKNVWEQEIKYYTNK